MVRPHPLKRVGIAMVVFRPGSPHMGSELLLGLPRGTLQVIVLERVDENFRLVQPRRIGRRIPRLPPPVTLGKVPSRGPGDVAGSAVLDQENPTQLLVMLAI